MFHQLLAALVPFLVGLMPMHGLSYRALPVLFSSPRPEPTRYATVLFGGDMMFDRSVRAATDEHGGDFIFSCLDDVLAGNDLAVANLEGPITAASSRSIGSHIGSADNYTFTFPTSTAQLLAAHHIALVNLGNNHILNFGASGVRSTIAALDGAGVGYFGDPLAHTMAERNINGVRLAFITYNEFDPQSTASTTIAQIQDAQAQGAVPVVYTHWGTEYVAAPPSYVRALAHAFVDAGAAIVVGSHSHVAGESEYYRDVPIYYSLGNFIFDQYWDDTVRSGVLLQTSFDTRGVVAVREIPTRLERDRRTCPAD